MKLTFAPIAVQDVQRLHTFISESSPRALGKAAQCLREAFSLLVRYPFAGYELAHIANVRELCVPFGKGHYIIRYRAKKSCVQIIHLWHSREVRE